MKNSSHSTERENLFTKATFSQKLHTATGQRAATITFDSNGGQRLLNFAPQALNLVDKYSSSAGVKNRSQTQASSNIPQTMLSQTIQILNEEEQLNNERVPARPFQPSIGKKSFLFSSIFKNLGQRNQPKHQAETFAPKSSRRNEIQQPARSMVINKLNNPPDSLLSETSAQQFVPEKSNMYSTYANSAVFYQQKPVDWNKADAYHCRKNQQSSDRGEQPEMATKNTLWGDHVQLKSQLPMSNEELTQKYGLKNVKTPMQLTQFRNPMIAVALNNRPLLKLKKEEDFLSSIEVNEAKTIKHGSMLSVKPKLLPSLQHTAPQQQRAKAVSALSFPSQMQTQIDSVFEYRSSSRSKSPHKKTSCSPRLASKIESQLERQRAISKNVESLKRQVKDNIFEHPYSVETATIKRELGLKRRPKMKRPESARQESDFLKSKLEKINATKPTDDSFIQSSFIQEASTFAVPTDTQNDPKPMAVYRKNYRKKLINNAINRSILPRVVDVHFKESSVDFKMRMRDFSQENDHETPHSRNRRLQSLYDDYASQVQNTKIVPKKEVPIAPSPEDTPDTASLNSDEYFVPQNDKESARLYKKLMKRVQKYKLKILAKRARREKAEYLSKINITEIQTKIDTEKHFLNKMSQATGVASDQSNVRQLALMMAQKSKRENEKKLSVQFEEYTKYLEDEPFAQHHLKQNEIFKSKNLFSTEERDSSDEAVSQKSLQKSLSSEEEPVAANMTVAATKFFTDNSFIFEEYLNQKEQQKKECSNDFLSKIEDNQISQQTNFAISYEITSQKMTFLQTVISHKDVTLPLLSKIKNKVLGLSNYSIKISHCYGLSDVFKHFPTCCNKFFLENCGLDDTALSVLIVGGKQLQNLEEITLKQVEIGLQTLIVLEELILQPNRITSLKIVSCRMNQKTCEALINMLLKGSCLKTLSLVDFGFTEMTFASLVKFLENDLWLENLDLSYSAGLKPATFAPFFEVLSQNTKLRSLNLAWCNFIENQFIAKKNLTAPTKLLEALKQAEERKRLAYRKKTAQNVKKSLLPSKAQLEKLKIRVGEAPQLNAKGKALVEIPVFKKIDPLSDITVNRYASVEPSKQLVSPLQTDLLIPLNFLAKPPPHLARTVQKGKTSVVGSPKHQSLTMRKGNKFEDSDEEEISDAAMIAVEGLYKFIRRNQNLQHIDLTRTNLTQVMIARICLGVKCSTSLVGAHFTDNPGVTQVLRDYLKNRMKCLVPVLPDEALNLTRKQILDHNDLDTKKVMMMQLEDPGKTIFQTKQVAQKTSMAVSKGASEKPNCQKGPTEIVSPNRSALETKSRLESAHSLESLQEIVVSNSLANEQIQVRNIQTRISQVCDVNKLPRDVDKTDKTLFFTRLLNHKELLPGSSQWRMFTKEYHECWICAQHVFTYIFWNPHSIGQTQVSKQFIDTNLIEKSLAEIEKFDTEFLRKAKDEADERSRNNIVLMSARQKKGGFLVSQKTSMNSSQQRSPANSSKKHLQTENKSVRKHDENHPLVYGAFTDWAPRPMLQIRELTELARPNPPPFLFGMFKDLHNISAESEKDLTRAQGEDFLKFKISYEHEYRLNWRRLITKNMFFKAPQLLNYEVFREEDDLLALLKEHEGDCSKIDVAYWDRIPLYVYPTLMKPGLNFYIVKQLKKKTKQPTHRMLLNVRSRSVNLLSQSEDQLPTARLGADWEFQEEPSEGKISHSSEKEQEVKIKSKESTARDRNTHKSPFQIAERTVQQNYGLLTPKKLNKVESYTLEPEYFLHKCVSLLREERMGKFEKKFKDLQIERQFYIRNSVWAPFRPDTKKIRQKSVENDIGFMKLEKIFRAEDQKTRFVSLLVKNFALLKELHLDFLATTDAYPLVTWLDFVTFCQQNNIIDEVLTSAKLDLLFVQVNTYVKQRSGLSRGEFFELLLRIARCKYIDSGQTNSFFEALKMLIERNIMPRMKIGKWQEYRETNFWNNTVNDILQANLSGLKQVYNSYCTKVKKYMNLDDGVACLNFQMVGISVSVKEARKCYVFAKMTTQDERKPEQYHQMKFVEFLEMICRGAMVFFDDPPNREDVDLSMERRIERIVEEVLAIKNLPRKEVQKLCIIDSEEDLTDEEY